MYINDGVTYYYDIQLFKTLLLENMFKVALRKTILHCTTISVSLIFSEFNILILTKNKYKHVVQLLRDTGTRLYEIMHHYNQWDEGVL